MADLTRPNFGEAWASEGEKLSPGEAKLKLGWVQEMMTYQYENYLQARQDEAILYLLQKGVPEYSATQEYTANKSVVVYQGNLYMATATVTGVLPTVTASWKRISPTVGANGAVSISSGGTGATTVAEARTNLGLGTASTVNLPTTNGVVVRSTSNTLISRLLTGTSGNISVTNPDGVAGNINIDVGSNVAKLNTDSSWTSKGGITLPKGSSGERGVEVPGKIRYNTELQKFEGYNGTSWNALGAASEVEITTLSGDGVTTSFTLTAPAFSETSTDVYIGGVWQNKGTYNVSSSTITFSEAPTPGTDNIQVVSRRVVDLGAATASQVSIQDTSNYYTATTVEGALREVGEDFAKLTSYTGTISADAEWSDVPAHSDPAFDVQVQALANRGEIIKSAVLSYPDYASASAAAATLPDGQIIVSDSDEMISVVNAGAIEQEQSIYKVADYAKIRSYTGRGTRLRVVDTTGTYWWARRGTASDNGGTVLKDGLGRSWEREYSGSLLVSWFGTDTNAIKKALSTPDRSIRFDDGVTFITNETVLSEVDDRTIYGGGWIKCSTPEINVFELRGARNKVSINIDCDNQASAGIVIPSGYGDDFDIFGCRVIKARSTIKQAFGIVSWSASQGRIHDNIVEDVFSLGDSGGSSIANGLARGIQVVPDGPLNGVVSIYNNTVRRIYGEEGDSIAVQIANTPPFPASKCIIENNTIENFSRRAVKVQCSYAVVKGNTCISDDSIAHDRTSNAISVIASDWCDVSNNILRLNDKFVGILVSGDGAGRNIVGNNVSDNTIINPRGIGISVAIAEGTSIKSNRVSGSEICPISVVNAPETSVIGNVLTVPVVVSIQDQIICASSPRSVISDNVINGHTIYRGIRLTSQYSTVSGNKILSAITSAAFSGPNSSNLVNVAGSAIVGNFVRNGASPMFLNFGGATTLRISDNVLLGEGSSESGINSVIIGSHAIPSSAYPTQYFSRGTVAINLSASGGSISGWICIESGAPGVWKEMANVAA